MCVCAVTNWAGSVKCCWHRTQTSWSPCCQAKPVNQPVASQRQSKVTLTAPHTQSSCEQRRAHPSGTCWSRPPFASSATSQQNRNNPKKYCWCALLKRHHLPPINNTYIWAFRNQTINALLFWIPFKMIYCHMISIPADWMLNAISLLSSLDLSSITHKERRSKIRVTNQTTQHRFDLWERYLKSTLMLFAYSINMCILKVAMWVKNVIDAHNNYYIDCFVLWSPYVKPTLATIKQQYDTFHDEAELYIWLL